jgi:hypothetical protein
VVALAQRLELFPELLRVLLERGEDGAAALGHASRVGAGDFFRRALLFLLLFGVVGVLVLLLLLLLLGR